MDCFYAAIEIRDNPALKGKPVAVGGSAEKRGVLTTCNYEARKFGCHSAMPTFQALRRCPGLILLPTRFDVYRRESLRIREIMESFTSAIEPLSLDEAYLDVSGLNSSAAAVASEIRFRIRNETQLTASAGIAPNKFLAKIASDWEKPDGQFEIRAAEVDAFVRDLPVSKIWGVGKATAAKLRRQNIVTCADLRRVALPELSRRFGKFGLQLYQLCRGIDEREVAPHRERKSLSNETTFEANLTSLDECAGHLLELYAELAADFDRNHRDRTINKAFVKLKFFDFTKTTAECGAAALDAAPFIELLEKAWKRGKDKPVRLIGVGVRFAPPEEKNFQLDMFSS